MTPRSVQQIVPATPTRAEYLTIFQPLPAAGLDALDPFLLLHHIGPVPFPPDNVGLPFGPHPHRGFETVTLVLQGDVLHHDSRGNRQVIGAGGVQWMTAARGIIHAENTSAEFRRVGGTLEILQLWINLPARLKMEQPRYQGLPADMLPVVAAGRGQLTVVAGTWGAVRGPAQSPMGVQLAMLRLPAGEEFALRAEPAHTVLCYVLHGAVRANGQPAAGHSLVQLGTDGDTLALRAEEDAVLLLGTAAPLDELVVQHGPFVMNTQTQIMEAMRDYQMGRMGVLHESETR
ncbi:pirin family protein [Hymenobacter sp. B81]|uniref:pirin family protein n=1 Tax=Hymenobacter sp. B81 TaxID=3344878 RepID=UPI0037DCAE0E